jgi:histidinol-phosphate aminotransferase
MTIDIRESLAKLQPYHVEDQAWAIKLDANENTSSLPSVVEQLIGKALVNTCLQRYPSSDHKLRRLIAESYANLAISADNVAIGCGSSEILLALCQAFGGPGKKIVFPSPSFSMYGIYAQITDSIACPVSLNEDFSLPVTNFIAAAQSASLVLVCNPNNPTGNVVEPPAVEKILTAVACPVILDEAYMEFYGESAVKLLADYPQLIVARTFSKAYGLAAARVGYMLASRQLIEVTNKVLLPYHVNSLSLAVAEIVCQNQALFAESIAATIRERHSLSHELAKIPGLTVYPSQTNFILIRMEQAVQLERYLAAAGTAVRSFGKAPELTGCLRITVGTAAENNILLGQIKAFFQSEAAER